MSNLVAKDAAVSSYGAFFIRHTLVRTGNLVHCEFVTRSTYSTTVTGEGQVGAQQPANGGK